MRKAFLTALSAALCLNISVCASAMVVEETAVETAVPATEISVADDFSDGEEGGLVPTYIDDTIEPRYTLPEENYTGAIPEETTASEWKHIPNTEHFGANEIVPAFREDGTPIAKYLTMGDLYQAWFENEEYEYNYPDYVCGVWTETGDMSELVVAVTKDEAGEAGKQEILSLIENDASVKFTYQSYTYKELRQLQDELSQFMGDESGIYGMGVYEMDNKVHAVIDMSNPNAEMYVEKLLGQYGDKLVFEAGSGITYDCTTVGVIDSAGGMEESEDIAEIGGYDIGGGASDAPVETVGELAAVTEIGVTGAKQDNVWIFAVCVAAVVVLGAVILFAVNRMRAKQTTAGTLAERKTAFSSADTEIIVKKSIETPQRDILGAVMEEIEK